MLCAFCPRTIWATSVRVCRNRPEPSPEKMSRACEKKIRSSERLELYSFQTSVSCSATVNDCSKFGSRVLSSQLPFSVRNGCALSALSAGLFSSQLPPIGFAASWGYDEFKADRSVLRLPEMQHCTPNRS